MNAFSTAAALMVLAATTAGFAAQTQAPLSPANRSGADTAPGAYQYQNSPASAHDSEIGANSDSASCQRAGEGVKSSARSSAFAATAAQDGMVEVALAGLALRKSHNDHVRQFSQRIIQDYAQSNGRLDSLVKCEGLVLPTELDPKYNAMIETLDATSGSAFEKAYLKHIGQRHSRSVALFESGSRSDDPNIAAFARKGLSMLQQHQELVDNLRVALGPTVASMH